MNSENAIANAGRNYIRNETQEQKQARIAKASETRKKNTREKRILQQQMDRALNRKYAIPIYEDEVDAEGNITKVFKKREFIKGSELVALRLFKEATHDESKNVVPAFKEIAKLMGEDKRDEVSNNTIVVQFSNKDIDI